MSVVIHGIRNCDTMKKARSWLEQNGIAYRFHDYKAEGVSREQLTVWCAAAGWETVLNRAGTTFRGLAETRKISLDAEGAIILMLEQPSMIKRPVLDVGGRITVGFKPETYAAVFATAA